MTTDSRFAFDDGALVDLAARHGTPAFFYRSSRAVHAARALRRALPSRVRLAYAVKANPHQKLLALLDREGLSFDCASRGELDRLEDQGVDPSRIFFAGPGKRDEEIDDAVARGVRIQAEGIEDLARVDVVARRRSMDTIAVNLRVQPQGVAEASPILGGSGPTAFGVDEEDLPATLVAARRYERVAIRGLHGFAASNETDADRLLAIHGSMMRIARRMQDAGFRIEQIDLGGGLGVPYAAASQTNDGVTLDITALGLGLERLLAAHPWFEGSLILEPGRFLAASCGVYVARVVRAKTSRGTHFAILEGGINHLLRPLLTGQPFPVRAVGVMGNGRPTTLAGPLCTALDRLGTARLPRLAPGDLLAFGMAGAYGATEAMVRFLDHPPAAEVWIEEMARQAPVKERAPGVAVVTG